MKTKSGRGIYLLPNIITMASLFLGLFALMQAISGNFEAAAISILVCIILDGLDGKVARLLNMVSRFGAEFDSLTDAIVFGVVPALSMYLWLYSEPALIDETWRRMGWLATCFYVASTVLRLARFNVQTSSYIFRGLPSPAAAALVMTFIWLWQDVIYNHHFVLVLSVIVLFVLGALMVSNFSYASIKKVDFRNKVPFIASFAIMTMFIVAAIDIPRFVFFMSVSYVLSGPAIYVFRLLYKHKKDRPPSMRSDT